MYAVLTDTYGETAMSYSYFIDEKVTTYLGPSDLHETEFDRFGEESEFELEEEEGDEEEDEDRIRRRLEKDTDEEGEESEEAEESEEELSAVSLFQFHFAVNNLSCYLALAL